MQEREQDVLRAASMYYLQDMKMEVIARQLGTSRSTVSRLIKRARDSGLVEITLRPASTRAPGLGQLIGARFGISAYVVPVPDSAAHVDRLDQVAITSAKLLAVRSAPTRLTRESDPPPDAAPTAGSGGTGAPTASDAPSFSASVGRRRTSDSSTSER